MSDQLSFDVDLPSRPTDADRAALLDLIAGDRRYRLDRDTVVDAIWYAALHANCRVDPNMVRARLTDPASGDLLVRPQVIGAVYHALAAKGVIRADGWTPSTDRAGGNYGKPSRLYRWVWQVAA